MKFTQPPLPYSLTDLEPSISATTIEYHYGKHEKAYIENLNKLVKDTEYDGLPLEEIIKKSSGALFNNASQAWNHIFYFFQFSAAPQKEPAGVLREQIDKQFGDFESFKKKFEEAGATLFGSGYVWLSRDAAGELIITQSQNAGNPMTSGLNPILTADVWEHAYYLDYQNLRGKYLQRFWDIVDWNIIESRYSGAD